MFLSVGLYCRGGNLPPLLLIIFILGPIYRIFVYIPPYAPVFGFIADNAVVECCLP